MCNQIYERRITKNDIRRIRDNKIRFNIEEIIKKNKTSKIE